MNCLVCKIKNASLDEYCRQCKADLGVHKLLLRLKEGVIMASDELTTHKQEINKLMKIIVISQSLMLLLMIFFISFNIVLEVKWVNWLKQQELPAVEPNPSKAELNTQLLIKIIEEQLALIKEQRKDNQAGKEPLIEQIAD